MQNNTSELGRVLVLGLGKTGESVCRYLAGPARARVSSITLYGGAASAEGEKTQELEAAGVRVVVGSEDVEVDYDLCVASPGISVNSRFFKAAAACSTEVIGEPELAFRESPERWIAVTGTNGKTTTTSLARALLEEGGLSASAVGNIGTLCVSTVPERTEKDWLVAELSSFQLECTREFHPRAAVLLNVTPDHLEWHGSMEAYAAAKERVFANMGADDLAVISADDDFCRAAAQRVASRGVPVCELSVTGEPASANAAFLRDGMLVVRLSGSECELVGADELKIFGAHNCQNALAAAAMALFVGVDAEAVRRGLRSFSPIEHRIEPVACVDGVRYVNDSKGTNTDSVEKALLAFEAGKIVVLLGGHDKMTDLSSLAAAVHERCRVAVCFGEAGPRIADALEAAGTASDLEVIRAAHLREAFDAAVAAAREGDVVLLSPACSSFDEFNNMGERGRYFKSLVADLARAGE